MKYSTSRKGDADFVKRLNRYFHDEEGRFFSGRHEGRITSESDFYKNFFRDYFAATSRNTRILDIGSGTGLVRGTLPEKMASLVCSDISCEMLKVSKANVGARASADYVVCDAENLAFAAGRFDIITCNAAMHHFPSIEKFASEAYRVLAPGGLLVIGFEANRSFWRTPAVSLLYRVISKFSAAPDEGDGNYSKICDRVNERLLRERSIEKPIERSDMLSLVDIHSPNAGDGIDYSKAFDLKELISGPFRNFRAKVFYHYDVNRKLFGLYNRVLFPGSAPQFSLILEKARTKILFLFVHLNYGGAEVGLLTTLKNLDRDKFEALVVSIEKKGAVGEEIEKLGLRVVYLDSDARLFNIGLIRKVTAVLRRERPDILHTSLFYANFFGRISALFAKPAAVITEERSMYTEKRFYHILLDRLLSAMTDRIVVCSKAVSDFTAKQEGIDRKKFFLIYNCVDAERFNLPETKEDLRKKYGYSQDSFIIGSVGSIIPKKGHEFLIRALPEIKKTIPGARLLIIGSGPDLEKLRSLGTDLGVISDIEFTGTRKDIPQLMKLMDVFVLPSLQEGFPRTIIEAMYLGVPVVASDISGIPEVVADGDTGFLIAPGDTDGIITKILSLYNDNVTREKISRNARDLIRERHMPGRYARQLEALYADLINQKAG